MTCKKCGSATWTKIGQGYAYLKEYKKNITARAMQCDNCGSIYVGIDTYTPAWIEPKPKRVYTPKTPDSLTEEEITARKAHPFPKKYQFVKP